MEANSTCTVAITMKNTGTDAWTNSKGYTLKAVGGNDPFTKTIVLPLGKTEEIKNNQTKTFTLSFKAPAKAGIYKTVWRMYKGNTPFGATVTKSVTVITLSGIAITKPAAKHAPSTSARGRCQ
jgi:hypothetical protein